MSRILLSHGVAVGPHDGIVRGKGKITYHTVSLSTSHINSDDSDAENEAHGAAAKEVDDPAAPQFDQQMPGYFQDFENRLYDQSTQIELLGNRVDSQFQEVFAQLEQLNIGSQRIEGKLDTLLRRFPPPQ